MQYCFRQDDLALRRMQNTLADCSLIYNWLCDDRVAEFYGGVSERKTWQQICEKYGGRAAQEEGVVPCIIEYDGDPIGYLQYYVTDPEEYDCGDYVDFSPFSRPMAIDLFIGAPTLWAKGWAAGWYAPPAGGWSMHWAPMPYLSIRSCVTRGASAVTRRPALCR